MTTQTRQRRNPLDALGNLDGKWRNAFIKATRHVAENLGGEALRAFIHDGEAFLRKHAQRMTASDDGKQET